MIAAIDSVDFEAQSITKLMEDFEKKHDTRELSFMLVQSMYILKMQVKEEARKLISLLAAVSDNIEMFDNDISAVLSNVDIEAGNFPEDMPAEVKEKITAAYTLMEKGELSAEEIQKNLNEEGIEVRILDTNTKKKAKSIGLPGEGGMA